MSPASRSANRELKKRSSMAQASIVGRAKSRSRAAASSV